MSQAPHRPQPARPFEAAPGSSASRGSRNPDARTHGSQDATLNPRLRPSLRALGGRLGGTWERDRRDTLFLLAVTLLAVLPHALYLPFWCTAGFAILFAWRLGLLVSGRPCRGAGSASWPVWRGGRGLRPVPHPGGAGSGRGAGSALSGAEASGNAHPARLLHHRLPGLLPAAGRLSALPEHPDGRLDAAGHSGAAGGAAHHPVPAGRGAAAHPAAPGRRAAAAGPAAGHHPVRAVPASERAAVGQPEPAGRQHHRPVGFDGPRRLLEAGRIQ